MKKSVVFFLFVCIIGLNSYSQNNVVILQYIQAYKDLAITEMQRTGIPAAIKLAQGIHETEAGKSNLVQRSNNHFGIKCKANWTGGKVYHDDDARGECFRSYPSAEDSYRDHSNFLRNNKRYDFLFQLNPNDYKAWAFGLREAGYATNIKYSQLLIKLIEDYSLQEYTLAGINKTVINESTALIVAEKQKPDTGTVAFLEAPTKYPTEEFEINNTRVIHVKAGTSLLAIAEQYEMPLARLLDFNDLVNDEAPIKDQLIFLQRKRKKGANAFHVVQPGETLYDICQAEGIRMESLLKYNRLSASIVPTKGEKIYLQ
jgi:LysM repeat protein